MKILGIQYMKLSGNRWVVRKFLLICFGIFGSLFGVFSTFSRTEYPHITYLKKKNMYEISVAEDKNFFLRRTNNAFIIYIYEEERYPEVVSLSKVYGSSDERGLILNAVNNKESLYVDFLRDSFDVDVKKLEKVKLTE